MEFTELLTGLIAIAAGALTSVGMGLLRKASTLVDTLPAAAKQGIVLALAFVVVQANGFLGLDMPVDALGFGADVVNTLITALLSFGVYNVAKVAKTTVA